MNYFNLFLGLVLAIIGVIMAFVDIKKKLEGKSSKYGYIIRGIIVGILMLFVGLALILRELF